MSTTCDHKYVTSYVDIYHLTVEEDGHDGLIAHLQIFCNDCQNSFIFINSDIGWMPDEITVSPTKKTIHIPIEVDG